MSWHSRAAHFVEGGLVSWVVLSDYNFWIKVIVGIATVARIWQSIRLDRAREKMIKSRMAEKIMDKTE